jgi:cyclic beta-1,2-glucan synthetase
MLMNQLCFLSRSFSMPVSTVPHSETFLECSASGLSGPFRVESLGKDAFKQCISVLAAKSISAKPPGSGVLLKRFHQNARNIHRTCDQLAVHTEQGKNVPSASEWLLDNRYIIQGVIDEVEHDLPRTYFRELKALQHGAYRGYPRIYALAVALLSHTDSNLNEDIVDEIVSTYQDVAPLAIGELWSVPTMLRLGLLENLRRLCDRVIQQVQDQKAGVAAMDSMLAGRKPHLPESPSNTYLLTLWEAIRENDLPLTAATAAFQEWTSSRLNNIAELQHQVFCQQAADQVTIGNAITSLRLLGVIDWSRFFEKQSVVEKVLQADKHYGEQDFATRDACRRSVERVARRSGQSEHKVARSAINLSQSHTDHPCKSNVSYWLLDEGQHELKQSYPPKGTASASIHEWIIDRPKTVYFGLLLALTVLIVLIASLGGTADLLPWGWLTLLVIPLSLDAALILVNFIISKLVHPRVLPRYEWKSGTPPEFATMVVIPALVCQEEDASKLLSRLEQHYLANPDPQLWFAMLTDFTDGNAAEQPLDAAVLHALLNGVQGLNARHGMAEEPRFFVLHRHRQWNASENCWMGWERKRGKLIEFNRLLRGDTSTSFTVQSSSLAKLPRMKYVLTLDADTVLPRDAARQFIARMAHPLNQAHLSSDGRTVERGYGIIQPRVNFLVVTGMRSWFARWMTGSLGIDPYSTASSDTYMDLFAQGTFTGKGLYDVDVFQALLDQRFPENHILSHDLIESNFATCALATDVDVFDEFPSTYLAYAKRDHRWIRGDWQLLPWLGPTTPTKDGRETNALNVVGRWKIIDNLRRSLRAPLTLFALVMSWLLPWQAGVCLLSLALLPLLLPFVIQVCSLVVWGIGQWRLRAMFFRLYDQAGHTLAQASLQLVFLPHHALLSLDAIARTLYRLFISRKQLLQWESAAIVEQRLKNTLTSYLISFIEVFVFLGLIVLILVFTDPSALWFASPFLAMWLISPIIARIVSSPIRRKDVALTDDETKYLENVVRKTWHFFETFVGPEDNWLPPDNYQEEPCGSVAHRTSPTNIGVYLLCTLTAYHFKLIALSKVIERLSHSFDTLEKLPKHQGHLLNWYETNTLRTLLPEYVSTVDSGNFWGCLLALKHGLTELAQSSEGHASASALTALVKRIEALVQPMDFQFLYNKERHLFSIGYNVSTHHLDNNHYDLLASEACIASYLAVAFGQAPRKHWFQLARMYTNLNGEPGLISWGGTMFEYLMPRLLLPILPGVLLDRMQSAAVQRQIDYGREINKPWGISESAYYAFDGSKQYQYQSFGVPQLGLKRGLGRDCVIAPYATLLAVDVKPREAIANLKRLSSVGGEGEYGFYEAIDYTTSRLPAEQSCAVIRTYMAHHQGMGMLAIANRLKDSLVRRWLHQEAAVKSSDLLLQERMPYDASVMEAEEIDLQTSEVAADIVLSRRRIVTADTPVPRTHLLSNGRYSLMVNNSGSGYSRWNDLDIIRWRSDPTTDLFGMFLYIRDRRENTYWSAAHLPTGKLADEYEVIYSLDKADFHRIDGDIDTLTEITVAPDADVELRRVTLTNRGRSSKHLDITSYAEMVLNQAAADQAHPAFCKLFLETEWLPQHSALLCRRRPRSPDQQPIWAVHVLTELDTPGTISFETDRARFLGRRRTPADPQAMEPACRLLSATVGAVLDPIVSIRRSIKLRADEKLTMAFTTGYADSRESALAIADRFHSLAAVNRAFELAYAHTQIELQHANMKPDEVHLFQRLAGHLLYPILAMRSASDTLVSNRLGQSSLWALGISGDLPIALLRMHGKAGIAQLKQLVRAHEFWRAKGLRADLIILCENAGGYYDESFELAVNQIRSMGEGDWLDKPGGIFVRKGSQIQETERTLLLSYALLVIDDRLGSLQLQGTTLPSPRIPSTEASFELANTYQAMPTLKTGADFSNTIGASRDEGSEYVIEPNTGEKIPPQPWSNVVANPVAGFLATDSGSGFTWVGNSQMNRLTPWSNDPVSDQPGEVIYLQDVATGSLWCPTPLPIRDQGAVSVVHGQGYTRYERSVNDIEHHLTLTVPESDPVKISTLKLVNHGEETRQLSVTFYVEWVLGTLRSKTSQHLVSKWDHRSKQAILVRNPNHPDYPEAVSFAATSMKVASYTGNRTEFLGRNRSLSSPLAQSFTNLSGQLGAGLDPCAALRGYVTLHPEEEVTIHFVLGQCPGEEQAIDLISRYIQPKEAAAQSDQMLTQWNNWQSKMQVKTSDTAFNALVNRWLHYQTLSCRVWGRSAFYQSGGAFGFRDQLQDVMALLYTRPDLCRSHILHAASRQFVEGDVQHWWHEPSGHGVRTRFSDDFLWLPFVVCQYVEVMGDTGILDEHVNFLTADPLPNDVHERYGPAGVSETPATLYEHCVRALDHGWKLGSHGLPLMGCGDWNDGMNLVGIHGKGESIWVAWFQMTCLMRFAKLAANRHDEARQQAYLNRVQQLKEAVEQHGYDGEWYRRAYFDDGTPLGSLTNDNCQIDSIAQSWAVLSTQADPERATRGIDSVLHRLVNRNAHIVQLFDPPFDRSKLEPGYIKGYLPGIRENGGQYTHGVCWLIQALARMNRADDAWKIFDLINPLKITATEEGAKRYQGEPYVIAADVYAHPQHIGRCGWTWYTGSASWLYRVAIEDILGFHLRGNRLYLQPAIPSHWSGFSIRYQHHSTVYEIEVAPSKDGKKRYQLDGVALVQDWIPLTDDGKVHQVMVEHRAMSAERVA